MKILKFEELPIWKPSIELTKNIYEVSNVGKFGKDFGLRDQIRRAIVSVSSNIVEGYEKSNNNELIRFLKIAKGSCGEVRNQLHISLAVGYISQETFDNIETQLLNLSKQISGFVNYLSKERKDGNFTLK